MKNIKFLLVVLTGSVLFISSCSKKEDPNYGSGPSSGTANSQQTSERKIKEMIKRLPLTRLMDANSHRIAAHGRESTLSGGWDFSNPGNGNTYTSPSGFTYSSSSNTVFLSPNAFGGTNAPSVGTVVAGPTSLDINGTFCFSASFGNGGGVDLFGLGYSGVSGVIGISGDFKALANANSSTSLTDVFHGLAYYIVYDDNPSGSYDVIDWFGTDLGNNTDLHGSCFAFIFDFQNGRLFMSKSGSINVSGGDMNFNGEYFQISGFVLDNNNGINTDDITFSVVPGFGTMGCN